MRQRGRIGRAGQRTGLALALAAAVAPSAQARELCTLVTALPSQRVITQRGECATRVTPASTFKIPLSLIAHDAGLLKNAHAPVMRWSQGEPDWGGPAWHEPIDPSRWMAYSVVWYSQRLTRQLGMGRLQRAVDALDYGNRDLHGDPAHPDGLTHAWIGSSLLISPQEQAAFLARMLQGRLPVSPQALALTRRITEVDTLPGGWQVHGKTGTAYPLDAKGDDDTRHAWGWFIGWAERRGQQVVFVRLTQDDEDHERGAGPRTRDALLAELPVWLRAAAARPR